MATVSVKCLVKMKMALNLWMEDMNRKCALIDGNMVCQKALSLYKDFSKVSPETINTQPFLESKRWLHRFRRSELKNVKITVERLQLYNFYYSILL